MLSLKKKWVITSPGYHPLFFVEDRSDWGPSGIPAESLKGKEKDCALSFAKCPTVHTVALHRVNVLPVHGQSPRNTLARSAIDRIETFCSANRAS